MTELQRGEVLCVPKRRRLVHSKLKSSTGHEILHVFYGEKEIVFDEPELLPFGAKLIETESFRAEDAMAWSDGAPHDWERVRELLEALLEHEILTRACNATLAAGARTFPQTLGGGAAHGEPRAFSAHSDQCTAITREAFGHAIDLGNLEVLVPVYRVAHAALDRDGRQVGENNVTPRPLFLDLPAERRQCKYAGSRYQSERPMNITALRYMTKRWPELLSLTEQFRSAFLARLPPRDSLTIGDAHLLTVACLAAVGYVMVRGVDPVPNGELDAGLAAMFRLIDGVRLVTTELLRNTTGVPDCELAIDAQQIVAYAERNLTYVGLHGVCAGPQALIDEYLSVLIEGQSAPIQAEPKLASRVGDLDAAIDYGLLGQRIESLVRSYGASQTQSVLRLRAALQGQALPTRLRELLEQPIDSAHFPLLREVHPLRETLELEVEVNRWLFARAADALPEPMRGTLETLPDASARARDRRQLLPFLTEVLPAELRLSAQACAAIAAAAAEVLALERSCLRAVRREQDQLNARLCRSAGRPLTADDLTVYTRPRLGPSLERTLAEAFDISIVTDASASVVSYRGRTLTLRS